METRRVQFIADRKLYELDNGFWEDDTEKRYDVRRDGKVFEEREPGMWYLIHRPETVVDARAKRFESVEGI